MRFNNKLGLVATVVLGFSLSGLAWGGGLTAKQRLKSVQYKSDRLVAIQGREDWGNPDSCDRGDQVLISPDLGDARYKELYAAVLASKLAGAIVQFKVDGCATKGNYTYPSVVQITVF